MHREGLRAACRLSAIDAIKPLNCDNACSIVLPPFNADYTFELCSDCIIITKDESLPAIGLEINSTK